MTFMATSAVNEVLHEKDDNGDDADEDSEETEDCFFGPGFGIGRFVG